MGASVLQHLDAVVVGHLEVGDHHVVLARGQRIECRGAGADRVDAVGVAELVDERVADVVAVVSDDQDAC